MLSLMIVPFFIFTLLAIYQMYLRVKYDSQRYKYFALRDKLILLCAKGEIEHRNIGYKALYRSINHMIMFSKDYDLLSIAALARKMKNEAESTKRQQKEIKDAISANKALKEIHLEFIETMRDNIIDNSFFLKAILSLSLFASRLQKKIEAREKEKCRQIPSFDALRSLDKIEERYQYV